MKRAKLFGILAAVALALAPAMRSDAALIFDEPFDHPSGNFSTFQTNVSGVPTAWTGDDTNSNMAVVNGDTAGDNGGSSLQYAGLAAGTGGRAVSISDGNSNNDQVQMDGIFNPPLSGTGNLVYWSFLFKSTGTPGPDTDGNNFMSLRTAGGANGAMCRPHIQDSQTAPGTGVELYARWRRNDQVRDGDALPETVTRAGADIPTGTTVFIVCKVVGVAGDANDELHVWLNPTPGSSEPAADAIQLSGQRPADTGNDVDTTGIDGIRWFRTRADLGNYEMDEFRLGLTWEEVTPNDSSVTDWRNTSLPQDPTGKILSTLNLGKLFAPEEIASAR